DPLTIAKQAEEDLNSYPAKTGCDASLNTAVESGVDETVRNKSSGASVIYGSGASGAGDNREIPLEEGGDINPRTGKPYKARDFEGPGGPEDKQRLHARANPGDDDARANVR
ncbi:hypothetical protein AOQ84DRAFT_328463, partial [Glonium stellatum]